MQVRIHDDGSFDLLGNEISLMSCYPGIDGQPLRACAVEHGADVIVYRLETGMLKLRFLSDGDGRIGLSCVTAGAASVHELSPVAMGRIDQAARVFVQGFGMEGPSGCFPVDGDVPASYGLTALYRGENVFLVYAEEHERYTTSFRVKGNTLAGKKEALLRMTVNLEGTGGTSVSLPTLYVEEGTGLQASLRRTAERIAARMEARKRQVPAFFWSSWYHAYETMDYRTLQETLADIQKERISFQYIELDAGYSPHLGDWLIPNHRWPGGLEAAAAAIREAGFHAGVWVAPFIVGDRSSLYREHPEWVLRDPDGRPFVQMRSYTEPKMWGNSDCDYYVLDTSHPDALAYIAEVFRTLKHWGFTFFKTDFLLWNMHDTDTVRRYRSDLTSVEILRRTMAAIRDAIGDDSYLLGCIAPFMPMIGYADGMRLAGDCGAQWKEPFGPVNMLRELPCDNYFNHIFWQNDPDAMMLRDFDTMLNPAEVRSLALLQALSGGAVSTSDPVRRLGRDRKQLLALIRPLDRVAPSFPCFGEDRKELLLTHHLPQGNLLFIMNPTEEPITVVCRMSDLFGEGTWYQYQYDWEGDTEPASCCDEIFARRLAPHASTLLFVTPAPLRERPANLWRW